MTASAGPRPSAAATLRLPARSRAVPTSTRLETRRVPAFAVGLVALVLAGGVIVVSQASGWWATTGRAALGASAESGGGGSTGTGPATTVLPASPEDVKGWMTLEQVLAARFPGVPEAGLRARFAIPVTVRLDTPLKDLDGVVPGFDVAALREWLAAPG
ncbi:MAG TPA: hypothetical protein VLS51_00305 [Propionibacteriaceae bacterium]|nr:hypothetical protein [Propionibacteriaceae bacterium]